MLIQDFDLFVNLINNYFMSCGMRFIEWSLVNRYHMSRLHVAEFLKNKYFA